MVVLNVGITKIVENLGVPFAVIMTLLVLGGVIIFYAKGFQYGTLYMFLISGLLFMLLYKLGLNYSYPLIIMFMSLVALAISLFGNFTNKQTGGLI